MPCSCDFGPFYYTCYYPNPSLFLFCPNKPLMLLDLDNVQNVANDAVYSDYNRPPAAL